MGIKKEIKHQIRDKIASPDTSAVFREEFVGVLSDVDVEDGGQSIIAQIDDGEEEGMFVRVQSWSEKRDHAKMLQFVGRKVRISVETCE